MTPDEFHETVVPEVIAAWQQHCFCASPGFQKLLSFDFRDYGIGPVALADAEILIDVIIRQRFARVGEAISGPGETIQDQICPKCQRRCTVRYDEFSINMARATVVFANPLTRATNGKYLVGFYGFKQDDFAKVHDFQKVATCQEFLRELKGT